jgi:hypothetical protein
VAVWHPARARVKAAPILNVDSTIAVGVFLPRRRYLAGDEGAERTKTLYMTLAGNP